MFLVSQTNPKEILGDIASGLAPIGRCFTQLLSSRQTQKAGLRAQRARPAASKPQIGQTGGSLPDPIQRLAPKKPI
jgi:hypothetical protein